MEKLIFKDQKLQNIWYKLLKGTKNYDFDKKTGYPSILDFITVEENSHNNKICIKKAPKELLTALFSETIADQIWESKKKLSIPKIKQILIDANFQNQPVWNILDFKHNSHKKKVKTIVCRDKQTQITLRKNYQYN